MTGALNLTPVQLEAIRTTAWLVIAIVGGVLIHRLVYGLLWRWARDRSESFAAMVTRQTSRPAAYIFPLLAILAVFPNIDIPEKWDAILVHATGIATIAAIAWTVTAVIRLWADITVARHRVDIEDNLLARQLGTRVDILTRVAIIVVVLIAFSAILMTFPSIRAFGTTLLASAGLAGVVVGLAARPLFENLFAGIQLAVTQPIRLDDVVIVEKQYGRIEEIHSTYVVVRLWDLRRLVVPLTYFINTPFENWTRRTANLLGEVFVFADWCVDVEAVRSELPKILERTPLWDEQVAIIQITDATDRAVQIRALVSARNSAELFDLRCIVREGLVAHLRDEQPRALPRVRVDPGRAVSGDAAPDVDAQPLQPPLRSARRAAAFEGESTPRELGEASSRAPLPAVAPDSSAATAEQSAASGAAAADGQRSPAP